MSNSETIQQENLTKLFSQAPAPIAICKGRELRYVFVNDAYAKIFNNRQVLGKPLRNAFPELEGQGYYEILEKVFDTGEPFFGNETPAQIDLANNGVLVTRYYNLVYTPYKSDTGEIIGVMAFGHDVTDQVEARDRERESDQRFKNIVEQSAEPILILKGEKLTLEVANDALFKLWNVTKDALGKEFLDILPEMENQGFHSLLLDVYYNGTPHYGIETPAYFIRDSGELETRYFDFIYQPYRENDGRISGVLVLATDVTQKVLAKQQRDQSEVNFRNLILQAPVAICVIKSKDWIIEIANQHMYTLCGRTENDMIGKSLFAGLPELQGQGFEEILDNVYTTGQRFHANEQPVQLPRNGIVETVYINFAYEALKDSAGTISGIIAVASDVTFQVLSRKKIEEAEEKARLAIDSAELGKYEIDLITNELTVDDRFRQIWGFDSPTIDIETLTAGIFDEDNVVRQIAHEEAYVTGNLHYEARINYKENGVRWIKVKGKVLFDENKKPIRLIGVVQNITEHKSFAAELAKQVDDRTKALSEANMTLERSNAELEQFAYIASHDLQEPLRKIQLYNSLLTAMPGIDGTAKNYIEKVTASALRMSGLIKDLLDYSMLSQKHIEVEAVDLNKILKNVLSDFEVIIDEKKAKIQSQPLPVIEAVPLQMNQVLYNLIGNALKFTKPGDVPNISISVSEFDSSQHIHFPGFKQHKKYYEIKVADKGIGFNQEYSEKIFTIFQKLNNRNKYAGYGIGLALCRKIAETHNGYMYAEGCEGDGATLTLIIPENQR